MDDMEMTLAECVRRYGSDERPPDGWCERHKQTLEPGRAFGKWFPTGCRECERERAVEKESARLRARWRERIAEQFQSSGIGERYQEATFDTHEWMDARHAKAVVDVRDFVDRAIRGEAPDRHWLMLLGPRGTGKTWLLAAAYNRAWDSGLSATYHEGEDLVSRFKAMAYAHRSTRSVYDVAEGLCRGAGLVLVDDFGIRFGANARPTPTDVEVLFALFNALYKHRKPMILSSNLDLAGLKRIADGGPGIREEFRRVADRMDHASRMIPMARVGCRGGRGA